MFSNCFTVENLTSAISPNFENLLNLSEKPLKIFIRVYHRTALIPATVRKLDQKILVIAEEPVQNLWAGNPVAFYSTVTGIENVVIGSGTIESPGLSIWEQTWKILTPYRSEKIFWNSLLESEIFYEITSVRSNFRLFLESKRRENILRLTKPYFHSFFHFLESRKWNMKNLRSKTPKFYSKN